MRWINRRNKLMEIDKREVEFLGKTIKETDCQEILVN